MSTKPGLLGRGAAGSVLVLAILGTCSGCDRTGPANHSDGVQHRETVRSRVADVEPEDPARTDPRPCPTESTSALNIQDRTTRNIPYGRIEDLVVAPQGKATLAWWFMSKGWHIRTSDQPSSPGDPQPLPLAPPPDLVPAGATVAAHFPIGDHLGVDGSGALTAMWLQDLQLASGQNNESYDLVLSDRAARGSWSPLPHVAGDGQLMSTELAVNTSGAAVVAWSQFIAPENPQDSGDSQVYVSYRSAAGTPWTSPAQIAPDVEFVRDVGIDDAGRVLVLYGLRRGGVMAIRGTPITGWSRPQPLASAGAMVAVSPGGAAVVATSRGLRSGRHDTIRMSRSGTWGAPVRQLDARIFPHPVVAMDGAGRALYVWVNEQRLMTRSSRRGGRWRAPCVLAEGVPDARYFDEIDKHVAVNRRGDALVVWRTKDPTPRLWTRYRPAGQAWSEPIEVTADSTRSPGEFHAAIGEGGNAAIAWISLNFRQLNILRISPPR